MVQEVREPEVGGFGVFGPPGEEFGEPLPEPEPTPPAAKPLPPKPPIAPVEVAPELKHLKPRIEKARIKQAARQREAQILQAHQERREEAQRIARDRRISVTEALAFLGAPVPAHRVEQARLAREVTTGALFDKPKEEFKALIKLGRIPKGSKFVAGKRGQPWAFITPKEQKRVATAEAASRTELARFKGEHIEVRPGEWFAKSDLAKLTVAQQKELAATGTFTVVGRPEKVKEIKAKAFPANIFDKFPLSASMRLPKAPTKAEVETFAKSLKDYLVLRFLTKPKEESQAALKEAFEANQALPMWQQIIGVSLIIFNDKTGQYMRVFTAEPPLVGPAGAGRLLPTTRLVKEVLKVGTRITVKSADDVGMDAAQFARFVKELPLNPGLTPEVFKLKEAAAFEKIASALRTTKEKVGAKEWAKIIKELEKAGKGKKEALDRMRQAMKEHTEFLKEGIKQRRLREASKIVEKARENERKMQAIFEREMLALAKIPLPSAGAVIMPSGAVVMTNYLEAEEMQRLGLSQGQITGTQTLTEAQSKALAKITGLTESQIKTLADAGVLQSLFTKTAVKLKPATFAEVVTKPATKTELKTATKLATKLAVKLETKTATKLETKTATKLATKLSAKPATKLQQKLATKLTTLLAKLPPVAPIIPTPKPPTKPKVPPKLPRLPSKKTDKQKRERIKEAGGAIAWRMGELRGKDVFHSVFQPWGRDDHVTVVGKKPEGAVIIKGPGSAKQTIRLLRGRPPASSVTGDVGVFDFSIDPIGGRTLSIEFTPDPKLQTTGDITIGRRSPPITERQSGLQGRGRSPRITPKRPRLRR